MLSEKQQTGNLAECQKPYTQYVNGILDNIKCRCSNTAFWKKLKLGMEGYLVNIHILCHFEAKLSMTP